ncbi:MAG: DUF2156 domain-containing protein [Desulfobacteraceae bacterium]|nr:DUF2156 domain-containing protein [Desulfobacteraceae bacterium]
MTLTFEPLRLEKQNDYLDHLSKCGQIASDYSFINLWGWKNEYALEWAWNNGLVWIRQLKPFPALWAPVGNWNTLNTIDCKNLIPAIKTVSDKLIRIPEMLIKTLPAACNNVVINETRGQWDYLYHRKDLTQLKGNRFHKKKNLVNQFKKKYESVFIPFGEKMARQALDMQQDWCSWRDCESHETLAAENKAIKQIINHWRELKGITGGALQVKNKLVAYTIAEIMAGNSLVIHFEKGNPGYKGSYQAINQIYLENAPEKIDSVNREQDLDNDGLRKAKLSYHPFDFIKKYEIHI